MDVVVVGSCNTDLISYAVRLPKPGETLTGHHFQTGCGGKGGNQAVMASRLGASTAMVAKLGNDLYGNNYLQSLKNENINTDFVGVLPDETSGVALISVDNSGQNCITIVPGANNKLVDEDIFAAENVIQNAKVMLCQLEILLETTRTALKLAKKHGVMTVLIPAPAQELDSEILSLTDYLCPNETEGEILTNIEHEIICQDDARKAIAILLERGCKNVIMTMGSSGCMLASQENRTPVHVKCPQVETVDTTGAGDAFAGSFAYYLSKYPSMELAEKVRRSCEIASISVMSKGTQSSYPKRKDISHNLL